MIVQSVLSATRGLQFVIVEESFTGAGQRGPTGGFVPPDEPAIPITDALVTLRHEGPSRCTPPVLQLAPRADTSGVYTTSLLCPLTPGDVVALRVETPDGRIVTGRTTVPGADSVTVTVASDTARLEFDELEFHRERDTLRIDVNPVLARAMQVEARWADQLDDLAFFFFSDTLGMAIAGNLVNPFEGDSGETIFRAGRSYLLSVAVTDSNYFDFIRSRNDPFTGRGFINHLEGGVGVFGSVETRTWALRVISEVDDSQEGRYELSGNGVSATLDLYLDDLEPGGFSAFVRGTWFGRTINRSLDGRFGADDRDPETFAAFMLRVPGTGPADLTVDFTLTGTRHPGGQSFPVQVAGIRQDGVEVVFTTLTARQRTGPGLP